MGLSAKLEIDDSITVGALAELLKIPVTQLITELMNNGVMATVNERIDFDTAQIIVGELGLDVELARKTAAPVVTPRPRRVASDAAVSRPPVVAVMGHVDHGKTTLLDTIRGSATARSEAGGITQHIAAYQVRHGDRYITFLDTPGHEAFAALREHGARLTDLIILVVAADDGIKPQTLEAIRFARKAGVKIVVAVNKIDKPDADPNRIRQQLSENGLLVEEWGGDTVAVDVSAKENRGIDKLLDMILLVADVEEIKADVDVPATGLIIEAHMEHGRGAVAEALVEAGALKPGDFIVAGGTYARVRNLELTDGSPVSEAGPSTPVVITGFKALPEFGDEFIVVDSEKTARQQARATAVSRQTTGGWGDMSGGELLRIIDRSHRLQELPVIIKADVQGSLTAVMDSLKTLDTDEVAVKIIGFGVGAINKNDVHLAHTGGAAIYGFNVTIPQDVKQLIARHGLAVRCFSVIYELIDDAKAELAKLLMPEIVEKDLGSLLVKGVFKTTKTEVICGGEVTKGTLRAPAIAKIRRGADILAEAEVTNLKRGPQDVKEVPTGEMCGVSLKTTARVNVTEGDVLDVISRETVARTI